MTNQESGEKLEMISVRHTAGTSSRIDKVLFGGELRANFIRAAVEAELQRREAASDKLNKLLTERL